VRSYTGKSSLSLSDGRRSHKLYVLPNGEIVSVQVQMYQKNMAGLRIFSSSVDGKQQGAGKATNSNGGRERENEERRSNRKRVKRFKRPEFFSLEPEDGYRIIGFYGSSNGSTGWCREFGIITAPRDVDLPNQLYPMAEFNAQSFLGEKTPLETLIPASTSDEGLPKASSESQ